MTDIETVLLAIAINPDLHLVDTPGGPVVVDENGDVTPVDEFVNRMKETQ